MKIKISAALFLIISMLTFASCKQQSRKGYETDFAGFFNNYKGAFVLYDAKNNYYIKHNEQRCRERYSPCSTFKIPNTLIGLETGVITDLNFGIKWDGTDYGREAWNKDQTLSSAMKNSTVWFYREIARRIGQEKMQDYINRIDYGNKDISGGIDKFWLISSLIISAEEQVEFLKKLNKGSLPFSERNVNILKSLIVQDSTEYYVFSGKTGSGYTENVGNKTGLGWFVGTVKPANDNLFIFAVNIEGDNADGMAAKEIAKNILKSMKLM